ncbi:efflux RND transporter periplasmic adaptor subunit [Vibrio sp. JPW-9-11-11]|uniref:efflux RND transporter periplasmic adaptor subunit n=1 Tax=Vibrio sp. JPW-9-11-11 TaxID=1416532 RepID=UPI00159318CB|nr:efflux RND transporter periplasmic adaptor subunit [Vibrio sp. JPW-9-11-11]NVD07833.1 efflux RND transporter periplasmic adaptor subunit [Vibrio sp. JPW-9-11-11]
MNASRTRLSTPLRSIGVLVLGLTLMGCNKANSEIAQSLVTPVKVMVIPDQTMPEYDSFIASIDATERAQLSFKVPGQIDKMPVRMGSMVKKGQVLATLDPTDYQLAYDAKLAQYDLAKTAYQRSLELYAKKLISADTFDQQETQYKAAKAGLEKAKTDLDDTKIIAPFDGVVSLTLTKPHQVLGANHTVLNLIGNRQMDVTFTVPVSYVSQYGLQQIEQASFALIVDSQNQVAIDAKFKEISTQPDTDTNSYSASLTFQRPPAMNLLPGMTGEVRLIEHNQHTGLLLADTAWVSKSDGLGQVYRLVRESQTIETVKVELDAQGRVVKGLNSGDLIVEAGVNQLVAGQQVKAWSKESGI